MQYLLFIFYLCFFSLFFYSFRFNKETGLSSWMIIFIFLTKVMFGCMNLYFLNREYLSTDSTGFYWQSIGELRHMHENPEAFFKEWLFNWGEMRGRFNFLNKENMVFYNHLGTLLLMKFMTFSNILSFGHQYVNVIFFNVVFFSGQLALYKVFYLKDTANKWWYVGCVFLIPSVLFWCSSINKDGFMLCSIGLLVYSTYRYLSHKKASWILAILVSMLLVFITRYFYFLCLLPPYLLWLFGKNVKNKVVLFGIVYFAIICIFFNAKYLNPHLDPMKMVQQRQLEFILSKGRSEISMPVLSSSWLNYVKAIPVSLNHVFMQPSYFNWHDLHYKLAALDNYLILGFLLFFLIQVKRKKMNDSFYLFMFAFALSSYLFIGFTISNVGAIVRYKSEFTLMLLSALIGMAELKTYRSLFIKRK